MSATLPDALSVSAIVLAGGEAKRLGGASKPDLIVGEDTLLDLALGACAVAGARHVVVVGPHALARDGVTVTREEPAGGGPVAGLAAGLSVLAEDAESDSSRANSGDADNLGDADFVPEEFAGDAMVLALACDMPNAADAVPALLEAAASRPSDGAWLVDDMGYSQPLLAVYRMRAIAAAALSIPELAGVSMRHLTSELDMTPVHGLHHASDDIDTWQDADRWTARPWPTSPKES